MLGLPATLSPAARLTEPGERSSIVFNCAVPLTYSHASEGFKGSSRKVAAVTMNIRDRLNE